MKKPAPAAKTPAKAAYYVPEGKLLAKLLTKRGSKSDLGRSVAKLSGLKCDYQVVNLWTKGVGFDKRNQRYVIEVLELADDYFAAARDEPSSAPGRVGPKANAKVVEDYLVSDFGRDTSARTAELLRAQPFGALGRTGTITPRDVHAVRVAIDALTGSSH